MPVITYASLLAAAATTAYGHGFVQGLRSNGVFYSGYSPSFQFQNPPPVVAGWSDPADLSNGPILPAAANTPDIICHMNATNAKTSMPVVAGGKVDFLWTVWPASHKGPVITWLAKCPGSCETVDKTTLEFFKVDQVGLISATQAQDGYWASDQMIANNNTWTTVIPSTLEPGNYVARHEIIALHQAEAANGAQIYPQCINLQITGSGSDSPTGVLGTALYNENSPGMIFNLYNNTPTYTVPGPAVPSEFAADSGTGMSDTGSASAPGSSSSAAGSSATTSASASAGSASTSAGSTSTSASQASSSTTTTAAAQSSTAQPCVTITATATITTTTTADNAATSAATTTAVNNSAAPVPTTMATSVIPSSTVTAAGRARRPLPSGVTLEEIESWLDLVLDDYYGQTPSASAQKRDLSSKARRA
ncbi:hypothetical protein ANO11243_003280 [Dothideomycetidae sp. 11243]|nr:hypothetical protein ANO11243_003280 [fungal sp. No.11243]